MRLSTGILCVLSYILIFAGCQAEERAPTPAETYSSASDQLIGEYDGEKADPAAVTQVLDIAKRLTLEARSNGILKMVEAVKAKLAAQRLDGAILDEVEDFTLGHPLPGVASYGPEIGGDLGVKKAALSADNPNKNLYSCPPIPSKGKMSCVQLIDAARKLSLAQLDSKAITDRAKIMIEQDPTTNAQPQGFKDYAVQYLEDLGVDISTFGVEMAAIRAEFTLRKAGLCDHEQIDGKEIARLRGIEESINVLRRIVGTSTTATHTAHGIKFEIKPQGDDCLRVGATGREAELKIERGIKAYFEEFKKSDRAFCLDMGRSNPTVTEANEVFMAGIRRGIKAHLATIWVGVFRNGRPFGDVKEYVVANIDGCNPRDQIKHTTSPLVIDLDGDGLQLSTDRVAFDLRATGQPQKVTWTGKREALLALDVNGDGRITSGRELFGNRTRCGAARCADGAAALARYDDATLGGNGDGRIDAKDKVFSKLLLWIDDNHDGRSQAGELKSLGDHGVRAFSVEASYVDYKLPGGKVSLTLGVQTDSGSRTAYDVWFKNLASPGFAKPLF